MKINDQYFDALRQQYPAVISKEQFYKIAHIGKDTARHLLQSGLVPCVDTGSRTHRYRIRLADVIRYLIDRELRPDRYQPPPRRGRKASPATPYPFRDALLRMDKEQLRDLRGFFAQELSAYDDLMDLREVVAFLGYAARTILNWRKRGYLKPIHAAGKIWIPKVCLLDFLTSPHSFRIAKKSWKHRLLIREYFLMLEEE